MLLIKYRKKKKEIEEVKKKHRQEQEKKQEQDKEGNPWTRIKSLVDFNKNTSRDITRMKNCLQSKIDHTT